MLFRDGPLAHQGPSVVRLALSACPPLAPEGVADCLIEPSMMRADPTSKRSRESLILLPEIGYTSPHSQPSLSPWQPSPRGPCHSSISARGFPGSGNPFVPRQMGRSTGRSASGSDPARQQGLAVCPTKLRPLLLHSIECISQVDLVLHAGKPAGEARRNSPRDEFVEFPFRNPLSYFRISQRLGMGFGLLLMAFLGYGAYALVQMGTLAEQTTRIHDHPVAVERAVLEAELAYTRIHRAMKDVSLSTNEEEIFEFVRRAQESEKIVHRSFDLLNERFLGQPSVVDEAFQAFQDWEPIRKEVIELTLRGDRERAVAITRGKGAVHVALLESKLDALRSFAERKRAEFLDRSQRIQNHSVRVTTMLLLTTLVVAGAVAWAISRSIKTPLLALTEAAERIAEGDFDHRVAVRSRDELGILARAVNAMAEDIAGRTAAIRNEHAAAQLRAATRAGERAEARERRTLARDLHDALSQPLALAGTKLAALRDEAGGSSLAARLGEVQTLIANADERARTLTFRLCPPVLHDLGIVAAAEWLAEDLKRQFGLHVFVSDDELLKPLAEETGEALFRSLREILINVARHARVDKAHVSLVREGEALSVVVEDAGIGFDISRRGAGFGLVSVQERLEGLGGRLEIESTPGQGTHARMIVPLSATEGSERPEPINDFETPEFEI